MLCPNVSAKSLRVFQMSFEVASFDVDVFLHGGNSWKLKFGFLYVWWQAWLNVFVFLLIFNLLRKKMFSTEKNFATRLITTLRAKFKECKWLLFGTLFKQCKFLSNIV